MYYSLFETEISQSQKEVHLKDAGKSNRISKYLTLAQQLSSHKLESL